MPKKKTSWKKTNIEIIKDISLLPKKIHPAMGVINNQDTTYYYFGVSRPCLATHYNEEEEKEAKIKENNLILIKDNKTYIICDNLFKDYELEAEMLQNNPRWSIYHIDKWLDEKQIPTITALTSQEIFEKIKKQFMEYLDLPKKEWYDYLTLWVMGTYVYSFFNAYPMIYLYGLKNTGKTKVMTISSLLSFNGEMFVGITPATLFRIIEANKPSLFLDEVEKLLDAKREGSLDIEAMLNSGYKKGATVPRCEKEKEKQIVKRYDVYCPKMFAHVEGKVSKTLISRCIRIIMERAKPNDNRSEIWPEKHNPIWQALRDELYIWALENWNRVLYYYEGSGKLNKEIGIDNRAWELWQPIFVLSKMVDSEVYEKMKNFAIEVNKETAIEEKEGREIILIECLAKHVDEEKYYFVSEIRSWLIAEYETIEEVPSNRSIGWELKRLGLTNRRREGSGIKWYLNKEMVNNLILKLGVNITQNTQTTLTEGDVVSVESVVSVCRWDIIDNNNNNNIPIPPPYTQTTEITQTTPTTPSQLISNIKTIINYLSGEFDFIPIEEVVKTARNAQISEERVEEALDYLLHKDMFIFEPRNGFIKKL